MNYQTLSAALRNIEERVEQVDRGHQLQKLLARATEPRSNAQRLREAEAAEVSERIRALTAAVQAENRRKQTEALARQTGGDLRLANLQAEADAQHD